MPPDFYNALSAEEKKVFDLYKGNADRFAYDINRTLRQKDVATYRKEIKILDDLILKNKIDKPIRLFRATSNNYVEPFIEGNVYTNPEFLSTTEHTGELGKFFRAIEPGQLPAYVIFDCEPEMCMASMESNKAFGGMERELLFGRNNKFEVTDHRVSLDRREIEDKMSRLYAQGVESLHIYVMKYIGN